MEFFCVFILRSFWTSFEQFLMKNSINEYTQALPTYHIHLAHGNVLNFYNCFMCSCVGCLCESVWMDWFGEYSKISPTQASTVECTGRTNNQSLTVLHQYHRDKLNDLVSVWGLFYVCIENWNIESSYSLCANKMNQNKWFVYFVLHPKIIFQMQIPSPNDNY